MHDQGNGGHNEKYVNQAAGNVECEKAQKPSCQKHNKENEKHLVTLLPESAGVFAVTVSVICQRMNDSAAGQLAVPRWRHCRRGPTAFPSPIVRWRSFPR